MSETQKPNHGQPEWITEPLSPADVAAINQGGCESGAYMPAVTYHQALKTMSEYGDEVLDYIQENMDELPTPSDDTSWSGFAVSTCRKRWSCTR